MAKQPQVYVVSDSLGETAESVAKATIGQYDTDIEIHRVPFIRSPSIGTAEAYTPNFGTMKPSGKC